MSMSHKSELQTYLRPSIIIQRVGQADGLGTYERQRNTSPVDLAIGGDSEASMMCQGGVRAHRPYDLGLVRRTA